MSDKKKMTNQEEKTAVNRLREYARRHADARTDAEFIAWVKSVLKQISEDEWQRVKKIVETDPEFKRRNHE